MESLVPRMKSASKLCVLLAMATLFAISHGLPMIEKNTLSASDIIASLNNSELSDLFSGNSTVFNTSMVPTNDSQKQMYVIKAVVYEIGILTEVDSNETSDSWEENERVDLTFFNAHKNGSLIDLGNIPVPIQANISGHSYTQILPFHLNQQFENITDILSVLPLPESVLNFTHHNATEFNFAETPVQPISLTLEQSSEESSSEEGVQHDAPVKIFHPHHVSQDHLLQIPVIGSEPVIIDPVELNLVSDHHSTAATADKKRHS